MIQIKFINFISYSEPARINMHIHDCYELVYYHSGKGFCHYSYKDSVPNPLILLPPSTETIRTERIHYLSGPQNDSIKNPETIRFSPHTYMIFRPFAPHAETHETAPTITTIGFTMDGEILPENILNNDVLLEIENLILQIRDEYREKKYLYLNTIADLVDIVLIKSIRQKSSVCDANMLDLAKNYIEQYYTTEISIADLATSCGYCLDHFRYLFRLNYGCTPKQYIVQKRMDHANYLLRHTKLSVNQIAENCGFKNYKNFVVAYKQAMKQSPAEYRKAKEGDNR